MRGFILDYFKHQDTKDPHYKAASYNPLQPLEGHKGVTRASGDRKIQVTKLRNGVTVVTEAGGFPNVVDLGS